MTLSPYASRARSFSMVFGLCFAALVSVHATACGASKGGTLVTGTASPDGDTDVPRATDGGSNDVLADAATSPVPEPVPDGGSATDAGPTADSATFRASDADADGGPPNPSGCAEPDLLFPPTASISQPTSLTVVGGYLWITHYKGLSRVPLSGGAPVSVPGIGGYPEIHPAGSGAIVVDGLDVYRLDTTTLATTKLLRLTGSYSTYMPRTAFDGVKLLTLVDAAAGTSLQRIDLSSGAVETLWTGSKATDLRWVGGRALVSLYGAHAPVIWSDPASSLPPLDSGFEGEVKGVGPNEALLGLRPVGSTSTDEFYSLSNTSGTPVDLGVTIGLFDLAAADDVRTVRVTDGDYASTVSERVGGTWRSLPCVRGSAFWAFGMTFSGTTVYLIDSYGTGLDAFSVARVVLP